MELQGNFCIALKPCQAGTINHRAPEALMEVSRAHGQALFGRWHGCADRIEFRQNGVSPRPQRWSARLQRYA